MKITEKLDSKTAKARHSVENAFMNPKSPLFCDYCEKPLGLTNMLRKSIFRKKGSEYVVRCKNCGKENVRVKGDLSKEIDENWKKHGFE